MNKIKTFAFATWMALGTSAVMTSCSNEPVEDVEQDSQAVTLTEEEFATNFSAARASGTTIPQDVIDRVVPIYKKATVGPQTVTTVHQLAILSSICATRPNEGPITVTPAALNGEEVTLITLGGTEFVDGQATTMDECVRSASGKKNAYLTALTNLFKNRTVPTNKPVVVAGISLGGMVAQQLLGQPEVMDHFEIRAIIAFGSPFILPLDRQGVKVVRFADVHDQVPPVGESFLRSGMLTFGKMPLWKLRRTLRERDAVEKITRTSKYTDKIEAHALSYIEDPCWDNVDFLGDPKKQNVLEIKETMHFYDAPKRK